MDGIRSKRIEGMTLTPAITPDLIPGELGVARPKFGSAASKSSGSQKTDQAKMRDAAKQFESLLMHEMMKSMWSTVPKDGILGSGNEEEMMRDMLSESVSDSVSKGKGLGIQDVVYKDMVRIQERGKNKW